MRATHRFCWLAIVCFLGALVVGCGDDEKSEADRAEAGCNDIVDAYGKLWEGCGTQNAREIWADEFACSSATKIDQTKVDECVQAIGQLNCSSKGVRPNVCAEALAK